MMGDPRGWSKLALVCINNGIGMGLMVGDPRVWSRLAVVCTNNGIAMG